MGDPTSGDEQTGGDGGRDENRKPVFGTPGEKQPLSVDNEHLTEGSCPDSTGESADNADDVSMNRRSYLALGAVTAASAFGVGSAP